MRELCVDVTRTLIISCLEHDGRGVIAHYALCDLRATSLGSLGSIYHSLGVDHL